MAKKYNEELKKQVVHDFQKNTELPNLPLPAG